MKQSAITQVEITTARESYRVAAKRGSVLYFAIADLALIDPMYQYSLEFFIRFFRRRLEVSPSSTSVDKRLEIIIDDITYAFYSNICRGLFEKDKLLFSFLICSKINIVDAVINPIDWNFFLRGSLKEMRSDMEKPAFLSENQWNNVL